MMRSQFRLIQLFPVACVLSMALPALVAVSLPTIANESSERTTEASDSRKAKADLLLKQGDDKVSANENDAALRFYQQALKLYQELDDRRGQGFTLRGMGNAYRSLQQYEKAKFYQQQALTIAEEIRDYDLQARALSGLGLTYLSQKKMEQATSSFKQSIRVAEENKNFRMIFNASINLGNLYEIEKRYSDAVIYYKQALAAVEILDDKEEQAFALLRIASSSYLLAKSPSGYQEAVVWAERGLKLTQSSSDRGAAFSILGDIYVSLKEYEKAINFYEQEIKIAQQIVGSNSQVAYRSLKIGDLYREKLNQPRQAIVPYQQAFANGDTNQKLEALTELISTHEKLKEYREMLDTAQQRLALARQAQNDQEIVDSLLIVGNIYNHLEEFQSVIPYYEEAVKISRFRLKDTSREAVGLTGLMSVYGTREEFIEAQKYGEAALAIYKQSQKPREQLQILLLLTIIRYGLTAISNSHEPEKDDVKSIQQIELAESSARETLALAKKLGNSQAIQEVSEYINFSSIVASGIHQIQLGNLEQALVTAERGLTFVRQSRNPRIQLETLQFISRIYAEFGFHRQRIEVDRQALAIAKQSNNVPQEIVISARLALGYVDLTDYRSAVEYARNAMRRAESIDVKQLPKSQRTTIEVLKPFVLSNLSQVHKASGEYELALASAKESLRLWQSLANPVNEALILTEIGELSNLLDKPEQAIEETERAWNIVKDIDSSALKVQVLLSLSKVYRDQQKALMFAEKALQISQVSKDSRLESRVQSRLSKIKIEQGDYAEALNGLQRQIKLALRDRSVPYQSASLLNLAYTYIQLGDYRTAGELTNQALDKAQRVKHPQIEAIAWYLLGIKSFTQKKPEETVKFLEKGRAISEQVEMPELQLARQFLLSIAYAESRKDSDATKAIQTALVLARKMRDGSEEHVLELLGHIHRRFGRTQEAIASYEQALLVSKKKRSGISSNYDKSGIFYGLGRIYADRKQPATAIAFYKKAINDVESERRKLKGLSLDLQKAFLQSIADFGGVKTEDVYRQLADLLLSQGQILEAQQVLELLKIQEIREFDHTTRAAINRVGESLPLEGTEKEIIEKYGSYLNFIRQMRSCQAQTSKCSSSEIDRLMELRRKAQDEYDRSIQALDEKLETRKKKDQDNFLDPRNPLSAKAARLTENRPDRAVIYSLVTDDRIWLIVATQGAPLRTFKIEVKRKELSETVEKLRSAMKQCQQPGYTCIQADTEAVKQISQKLYRWLFPAELQKEIPSDKIKHLIFSIDRNIRYIPMSALFDGEKYLIEKYAISSITTADRPENEPFNRTAQDTSVLAMGASKFPSGESPLPNVEIEVNTIVKDPAKRDTHGIYSGLEFLNEKFTKRNLQNSLYGRNILHLASHGVFNLTEPHESYIALGDGEKLRISEISKLLDLNTIDLVVLSACQTALGGRENEEGVEIASLGSAFLQKQAKSVLASLWSVDDISTSLLMQQVYQNLAKNSPNITRAEALRQAQQKFIEGKMTIADGKRLRQSNIPSVTLSDPAPSQSNIPGAPGDPAPNRVPDYRHPYYWSPFILMGSGF